MASTDTRRIVYGVDMNTGRISKTILTFMVACGMQVPVASGPCAQASEVKRSKSSSGCNCGCGIKCRCCCSKKKSPPKNAPEPTTPHGCTCGRDKTPPAAPTPMIVEVSPPQATVLVLPHAFDPAATSGSDEIRPTAHAPPGVCLSRKTTILQV